MVHFLVKSFNNTPTVSNVTKLKGNCSADLCWAGEFLVLETFSLV